MIAGIFLKSKSYCISLETEKQQAPLKKIAMKGARKNLLSLNFDNFEDFIFQKIKSNTLSYRHVSIQSKKHHLTLNRSIKNICNRQYVKRFLFDCGIKSISYGHPIIPIYLCLKNIIDCVVNFVDN